MTPDVSVVLAVYNTMPYLTECLASLAGQSIGPARMEVVAVDDGSTDGSGAELDRFARRHPGPVTVLHQANSGGPAGPFNRGLDAATGRYVFFVGADDRLGPEALERMVAAADRWGSDVLLGRVVGVNSRHIYQDVFARTEPDLDLFDSPLPRSLANTKLFRRDLLTRHAIRYREDMRIGSDLPFTLEACYRADRISVLADYDCYYAVRRFGDGNITYVSRHGLRVATAEKVTAFVAGLIPPGKQRDAVMLRRFDHEIARLVEDDLLAVDRATQALVHEGVGRMTREHLTGDIEAGLGAETRIRLAVARDGDLDDLLAVIRQDATAGVPATVRRGGRRYARYPGFGRLPDACFDVTSSPDWAAKLDATAVARHGDELILTARGSGAPELTVSAEEVPAAVDGAGTDVRIRFRVADLLARTGPGGQRRIVSAQAGPFDPARAIGAHSATGAAGAAAVRAPGLRMPGLRMPGLRMPGLRMPGLRMPVPVVRRHGNRLVAVAASVDPSGRLMIAVVPLSARRIAARLRRALRR